MCIDPSAGLSAPRVALIWGVKFDSSRSPNYSIAWCSGFLLPNGPLIAALSMPTAPVTKRAGASGLAECRDVVWSRGTRNDVTTILQNPLVSPAFQDGVYELFYRHDDVSNPSSDSLLLVMRQGQLLGADRWGGLISGHCRFDPSTGRHRFDVVFDAPAHGTLVTGNAPPSAAQPIELVTDVPDTGRATGTIDLFGASVTLELQYRGPLPLPPTARPRA